MCFVLFQLELSTLATSRFGKLSSSTIDHWNKLHDFNTKAIRNKKPILNVRQLNKFDLMLSRDKRLIQSHNFQFSSFEIMVRNQDKLLATVIYNVQILWNPSENAIGMWYMQCINTITIFVVDLLGALFLFSFLSSVICNCQRHCTTTFIEISITYTGWFDGEGGGRGIPLFNFLSQCVYIRNLFADFLDFIYFALASRPTFSFAPHHLITFFHRKNFDLFDATIKIEVDLRILIRIDVEVVAEID